MNTLTFNQELALELYKSTEDFPVDFDRAYVWIGYTRKDSAKEKLTRNFERDMDYEVSHQMAANQTGQAIQSLGGRPKEIIKLTIDCFKQLAMMAGTEKGKQVRKHFLECEKITRSALAFQPKTSAEMLLFYAQQLVEQERRVSNLEDTCLNQESRLTAIEAEQERYQTPCGHKYTVMGFANLHSIRISARVAAQKGKLASELCRQQGLEIERINDPRFGKVGLYPQEILTEVFK